VIQLCSSIYRLTWWKCENLTIKAHWGDAIVDECWSPSILLLDILGARSPVSPPDLSTDYSVKSEKQIIKLTYTCLYAYEVVQPTTITWHVCSVDTNKIFFLGDGYNYWGIELIRKLRDPDYQGTARFPYNTLCDMWLRRLGSNQHRYTIQCTMSVNLFNEKVCISYSK